MIAFSFYVIWDARRSGNMAKLLFIIPVIMSVFLFPPFVTIFSETGFAVYRTALILICFLIAVVYVIDQQKRQRDLAQKQAQAAKKTKKANKKK